MKTIFLPVFLTVALGLAGCVITPPFLQREAKFHHEPHREARAAAAGAREPGDTRIPALRYPPVTLKVGEKRLMTTSAGGMGGWFLSVETADHAIAKPISGEQGKTYLEAVSSGETTGYYGNSANLRQNLHGNAIGAFRIIVETE